jgi:cytidine deaminase
MKPNSTSDALAPSVADREDPATLVDPKVLESIANSPDDIVLAVTRPIGTNTSEFTAALSERLKLAGYAIRVIKISALVISYYHKLNPAISPPTVSPTHTTASQKHPLMVAGDYLRFSFGTPVLARLAIAKIAHMRAEAVLDAKKHGQGGIAFIVTNLMHPDEVSEFRAVYKQRFFLLGVTDDLRSRRSRLMNELESSGRSKEEAAREADTLLRIDQGVLSTSSRMSTSSLSVDETFHQADVFLDAARPTVLREELYRFFDQVFAFPFGSLSMDEIGMGHAYIAAKASGALGRRVGAALLNNEGSVLGSGWNDPGAAGGGVYRQGKQPDYRDHHMGRDISDELKIEAIHQFLAAILDSPSWLEDLKSVGDSEAVDWLKEFASATKDVPIMPQRAARALPALKDVQKTRILNLIEFGRPVHAEMAALTDTARKGSSTQDGIMYVTTFPCHECARNIVAAGISRLVFVEPYGKSMASSLYAQEISSNEIDDPYQNNLRVKFEPYVGIAPARFDELFSWVKRKHSASAAARDTTLSAGQIVDWERTEGSLRASVRGYTDSDIGWGAPFNLSRLLAEQSVQKSVEERIGSFVSLVEGGAGNDPLF